MMPFWKRFKTLDFICSFNDGFWTSRKNTFKFLCVLLSALVKHECAKFCSMSLTIMQKQHRLLLFYVFPRDARQIILHNYQQIVGVMDFQQDLFIFAFSVSYRLSVEQCVVYYWGLPGSACCLCCCEACTLQVFFSLYVALCCFFWVSKFIVIVIRLFCTSCVLMVLGD